MSNGVNLNIAAAVGEATTAEFEAFISLYQNLPDLALILEGNGANISFPSEPSVRYATTIGLTFRANDVTQSYNAFRWLADKATAEWVQLFATDLFRQLKAKGQLGSLAKLIQKDSQLKTFFQDFRELLGVL